MKTKHIKINNILEHSSGVQKAAAILKDGGVVAIPTETVYGLAVSAYNEDAIAKVFKAKGRPQDNPLIVHISEFDMLEELVSEVPDNALECARLFWPGPFTMVLPRSEKVPDAVTAGLNTVAVRMPSNTVARAIIGESGLPLAAPSANISGAPSTTTAQHVLADMDGKIDAVVISAPAKVGLESTVVTFCEEHPVLLRPGAVTVDELLKVLPDMEIADAVLQKMESEAPVPSPGMKYKHYAPSIEMEMVVGGSADFAAYANSCGDVCAVCFDEDAPQLSVPYVSIGAAADYAAQASRLFDALREIDTKGKEKALAHAPETQGIGLAVYNRMLRACAFKVKML